MLRNYFKDEKEVNDCVEDELISASHKCSLAWSDKCTFCEVGYDELAKKHLSTEKPLDNDVQELKQKIELVKANLEGSQMNNFDFKLQSFISFQRNEATI